MDSLVARDLYSSRSATNTYVPGVVCASISVVAVALRLGSRARAGLKLALDDYFAIITVVFFVAFAGIQIWAFKECGWGVDPAEATPEILAKFLLSVYSVSAISTTGIVFGKLAVLWLFRRIFGVDRIFRRCVDALMIYSIIWGIVVDCLIFFQCTPIAGGYDLLIREKAKCINLSLVTVIAEPINGLSEFLMVILPVNQIRKLHLPVRQRVGLALVFGVGILCVASSIARAVEAYWPGAETIDLAAQAFWVNIQMLTIVLVSCLPTYRKLLPERFELLLSYFRKQATYLLSGRKDTSAVNSSAQTKRNPRRYDDFDMSRLNSKDTQLETQNSVGGHTDRDVPYELHQDKIYVRQDISVI